MLDSGVLADCWRAGELYAEINGGDCLGLERPTLGSPAGRKFLVEIALDERHLEGSRRRALQLLTAHPTLHGPKTPLDAGEQGPR